VQRWWLGGQPAAGWALPLGQARLLPQPQVVPRRAAHLAAQPLTSPAEVLLLCWYGSWLQVRCGAVLVRAWLVCRLVGPVPQAQVWQQLLPGSLPTHPRRHLLLPLLLLLLQVLPLLLPPLLWPLPGSLLLAAPR
jgi:hypothetical protein